MDYTSASGFVTDNKGRRQFVDRDIPNGVPGTSITAEDLNAFQNTLAQAMIAYGIALVAGDDTLLAQAMAAAVATETTRATTIESNLQSSKANASDVVSGIYGVGAGAFAGKSLIQGAAGPGFCYNNGTSDVWETLIAALSDSTRSGINQLGFNFSAGHLDAVDIGGATHTFLPGAQQSVSGGTLTQIGNQKWQAFYIENIAGSGAQVTFPVAFSALPTVLLLPTSEVGTNLAIQANPVRGTLSATGVQVNINNGPGSASTAGCGMWVWAFGAA